MHFGEASYSRRLGSDGRLVAGAQRHFVPLPEHPSTPHDLTNNLQTPGLSVGRVLKTQFPDFRTNGKQSPSELRAMLSESVEAPSASVMLYLRS